AHDPADVEGSGPSEVGEASSVLRSTAAAGESHVDVDDDVAYAAGSRRLDRRIRVDGERDSGFLVHGDQGAKAASVDHLVGQHEVAAQPGGGHSLALPDGGARKPVMPAL